MYPDSSMICGNDLDGASFVYILQSSGHTCTVIQSMSLLPLSKLIRKPFLLFRFPFQEGCRGASGAQVSPQSGSNFDLAS